MEIEITLTVDVDELEIDATVTPNELTTEYWGSVSTERWTDVEIRDIMYNGVEAELLHQEDVVNVETHLINNREDYS